MYKYGYGALFGICLENLYIKGFNSFVMIGLIAVTGIIVIDNVMTYKNNKDDVNTKIY